MDRGPVQSPGQKHSLWGCGTRVELEVGGTNGSRVKCITDVHVYVQTYRQRRDAFIHRRYESNPQTDITTLLFDTVVVGR